MMELNWTYKPFADLLPQELYAIMRLRNEVFVIEQNCIYQDADGLDIDGWHFMGWQGEQLVAYCRILPPGLAFAQASIGRVVSAPMARGTGIGRRLMEQAIEKTLAQFSVHEIKIGAQQYLQAFYTSLGFVQSGPGYLEDNIPHIPMVLKK
jgi:ElaA protein